LSLQRRFKKPAPAVLQPNTGPRLLNIPAAAAYLGCHVWALRMMVKDREIPHVKIGRAFMLD
jgi:excisionase family DNA binding protein